MSAISDHLSSSSCAQVKNDVNWVSEVRISTIWRKVYICEMRKSSISPWDNRSDEPKTRNFSSSWVARRNIVLISWHIRLRCCWVFLLFIFFSKNVTLIWWIMLPEESYAATVKILWRRWLGEKRWENFVAINFPLHNILGMAAWLDEPPTFFNIHHSTASTDRMRIM